MTSADYESCYYTIPSDNRELQRCTTPMFRKQNYTIPSDNRELQPVEKETVIEENYTIPSDANSASSDHRFR